MGIVFPYYKPVIMSLSIATWNVNSLKSRLHQAVPWLETAQPDVVLLQELKCMTEAFPYMEIEALGYNVAVHGQKTYNGVAILSKHPIDDVQKNLPNMEDDQARYIEAVIMPSGSDAVRVASVYVPNGNEVGSDKFAYKLQFLARLKEHLASLQAYGEKVVIGGDYNVAPQDADVYDAAKLNGSVCFHPDERAAFREIEHMGYLDAYRLRHPDVAGNDCFTWWDYRGGSYQAGKGMRIDHLLISPQAADCLTDCSIHRDIRGEEKPSDHVPMVGRFC